jgi:hypothetical protein
MGKNLGTDLCLSAPERKQGGERFTLLFREDTSSVPQNDITEEIQECGK